MKDKKRALFLQEKKYDFLYHFLPQRVKDRYVHARYLPDGHEYLCYIERVLDRLKNIEFDSLLDLGCGEGRFLFECARVFSNKELCGADCSEKAIGFAKILNPGVTFFTMDFIRPITADFKQRFDVLTLIDVLEHIPPGDCEKFVKNIHTVLKANGSLLLTVPSKNKKPGNKHFRHFDLSDLSRLLAPRFEIKEHCFLNKMCWQASLIRRLFSNRFFILNHEKLANMLFNRYHKRFLDADEKNGRRVFLVCKAASHKGVEIF